MDFPTYKVTERTYRYGVRIPDSNFFDYLVSTYDLVVDKDGKISPYDTLRITKIDCSHRGIESFSGIVPPRCHVVSFAFGSELQVQSSPNFESRLLLFPTIFVVLQQFT